MAIGTAPEKMPFVGPHTVSDPWKHSRQVFPAAGARGLRRLLGPAEDQPEKKAASGAGDMGQGHVADVLKIADKKRRALPTGRVLSG